jgi:hypothetical protein
MTFQCEDLERALQSPELMPQARAHAERCDRCAQQLYLWSEISRLAPALHEEWKSPGLWARIRADMETAAPVKRYAPWRHRAAAAAAAMAVLAVSAVLLWQPWHRAPSSSPEFLTEQTLQEVQRAEAAYARSIEKLTRVAGPGLEQSPSPLAEAYREKLVLLDSEIAELRASVEDNRYNAYLQMQLASVYREKQTTLQEWMKNGNK